MSRVGLSQRLQMLADMVTPGSRLVDVGCDHGYLSIDLVRKGVCPGALAMDIRKGPLECAREHIRESGLGDYIKVRLSDGLGAYTAGEADAMVCAGMGGRLMEKILTDSMGKVRQLRELILQPQSELREFRAFLRRAGFALLRENAVCEEGKYYFAMKVVPAFSGNEEVLSGKEKVLSGRMEMLSGNEKKLSDSNEAELLYDMFGKLLLTGRHPVLLEYLLQRQKHLEQLQKDLTMQNSEKAMRRRMELKEEIAVTRKALLFYDPGNEPGMEAVRYEPCEGERQAVDCGMCVMGKI